MTTPPTARVTLAADDRGKRVIFTGAVEFAVTRPAAPTAGTVATLRGRAIPYGTLSTDRGGYKVRLMPGSARFAANVHALWHHDFAEPLADTASRTLRIDPRADGVYVEIDLPDTSRGRDTLALVESGRVRGMSFAMADVPTSHETEEGADVILNADDYLVDEVTVTAIPAFAATSIAVKPSAPPTTHAAGAGENPGAEKGLAAHRQKLNQYRHDLYRRP